MSYPAEFERLWNAFTGDHGPLGPKNKAFAQFQKMKADVDHVIMIVERQHQTKTQIKELNKKAHNDDKVFCPNFPHVLRYIRDERWKDPEEKLPKVAVSPGWKIEPPKPKDTSRDMAPEVKKQRFADLKEMLRS